MNIKENLKKYLKETGNKVIVSLLVTVIISTLAFLYANKNQLLITILVILNFAYNNMLYILIFVWLIILSVFLFKLKKRIILSKSDILEKQIQETKTEFDKKNKEIVIDLSSKITKNKEDIDESLFNINKTLIDFEIENHKKKGQVGEISKTIDKLEMDIKSGYGIEDTLFEIKKYINDKGMPNYFYSGLVKVINKVPVEFKAIKDEILKLAQEKFYKVNE